MPGPGDRLTLDKEELQKRRLQAEIIKILLEIKEFSITDDPEISDAVADWVDRQIKDIIIRSIITLPKPDFKSEDDIVDAV